MKKIRTGRKTRTATINEGLEESEEGRIKKRTGRGDGVEEEENKQ